MRLQTMLKSGTPYSNITVIVGLCVLTLTGSTAVSAQGPAASPPAAHGSTDAADQNKALAAQIAELRAQIAKLQAATQPPAPAKKGMPNTGMKMPSPAAKGMSMGMMDDKSEMAMPPGGGMMDDKDEMAGMSAGGQTSMAAAPAGAMGMCCMGDMGMSGGAMSGSAAAPAKGMAGMSTPTSAMPGQPGASHLYHVGSTGFFLNHKQHITLTADQKVALNRLKEKAMLGRASEQRKTDQAEQELYMLTGADQFDKAKVQAKIGEIERLRAEQRMHFIEAVGEAIEVLTHDQHLALMGTMAASTK